MFYQWVGDRLQVVASLRGYTSHILHTNNTDMAVAGDFDGDGQVELIVPAQDLSLLAAIRRTTDGAEVAWAVPADGIMTTNLAAVRLPNGELALAVGREDNSLRIWQP